ncbi:E3 ubiquitin-protein ligase UBR7 [Rhodotorula toruloides]|uniref:E3 ubiquitin-protein ligase UBR7 n=1 Tax=Rhodotorula toruloides TaxID=5286 RepID=A0A511KDC0_RHOTO|nr:E3 ubiquitin-protein ligase UBR7 [Rhodotorula toruloides]
MLNREALLFSPTREGVPSSDDFVAEDLIGAQEALEAEAREIMPYKFDACTYDLGYIKQPLFACQTCLNDRAVCAACSIACHGDHSLVELFNRRNFRCDCGTEAMGAGSFCSISHRNDAPANTRNHYDKNFEGVFCFCGRPYDPHTEVEDMLQCLVCEDWLHESCVFGASNSDPPLRQDEFDTMVCQRCVRGNGEVRRILERYAGVEGTGVMLVAPDGAVSGRLAAASTAENGAEEDTGDTAGGGVQANGGEQREAKRKAGDGDDVDGRLAKKAKVDLPPPSALHAQPVLPDTTTSASQSSPARKVTESKPSSDRPTNCQAPPLVSPEETPLAKIEAAGGRSNVFLADNFTSTWCRCSQCLPSFINFPYLLDEEDTYEPPDDPDAQKSTFDLGMDHLLNRMPRGQAIDSIQAFTTLSDRLKDYLRPLAASGTTITKDHIESFFEAERERRQA